MTLVDIQITPSTLQAYTTNNSYTIWMIGVFTEIRVSFTLDKYGKFLTLSDQLQAYDIDETIQTGFWSLAYFCVRKTLLVLKSVEGTSRQLYSVLPSNYEQNMQGQIYIIVSPFPVQLHLLVKCICLCVSSFVSL